MAASPATNGGTGASLVPHGSPDIAAAPSASDIPPITQDEVLAVGQAAAKELEKKEEEKKKKAATKKRKTTKKKGLVSAPLTPTREATNYYDIQNFIVTSAVDLEQFGIAPLIKPIKAPKEPAPAQIPPPAPAPKRVRAPETTFQTERGNLIGQNAVFCPDCGLRVWKHEEEKIIQPDGSLVVTLLCPLDD